MADFDLLIDEIRIQNVANDAAIVTKTFLQDELVYTLDTRRLYVGKADTTAVSVQLDAADLLNLWTTYDASDILVTPALPGLPGVTNVYQAVQALDTHVNDSTIHYVINDGSVLTTIAWSGNYIKAQLDALSLGIAASVLPPVQDIAALKALNTTVAADYPDKTMLLVEDNGLYRLDRDSTATENIDWVVQPTTGVGRWIKLTNQSAHLPATIAAGSTSILSIGGSTSQQLSITVGGIDHDQLLNFVLKEHLDWTISQAPTYTIAKPNLNLAAVSIGDLGDVDISGITNRQAILWDTTGSKFLPFTVKVKTSGGAKT